MEKDKLVIKPKLKGDDGYRVFSIRIKEDTVSKIENIVVETGRSRNELIGILLEYALSNCEIDTTRSEE